MTSSELTIRPVADDEIGVLRGMISALAEYEKLSDLCVCTEDDLRAALGARPAYVEALIAQVSGEPVGFALFFHTFSTFLARRGLWLEDLFVYPHARGRGVGKALLGRVAAIAAERGCGRFEWAVLDWNATAIRFYESLGATVMPDWRIVRVTGKALASLAERPTP